MKILKYHKTMVYIIGKYTEKFVGIRALIVFMYSGSAYYKHN